MSRLAVLVVFYVSTAVVSSSVLQENQIICSDREFSCSGRCVSLSAVCDGRSDCEDGSDEASCSLTQWLRRKRQTRAKCPNDQWQCDDGTCVGADTLRDGTNDCPDGSDEISYICHDSTTHYQCKDASCIDIDRKCDGVRDCPHGEDEINDDCGVHLHVSFVTDPKLDAPIQRIPHSPGVCEMPPYPPHGRYTVHSRPKARPGEVFKSAILMVTCDPGYETSGPSDTVCYDGIWSTTLPDCVLTTELCVLPPYPAYGSYMMTDNPDAAPRQAFATAELIITCDDGYDISGQTSMVVLCHNGRWSGEITDCVLTKGACVLPPYPNNGGYNVSGNTDAAPGQTSVRAALTITCLRGYSIHGEAERTCYNGRWSADMVDCIANCHLDKDPTVMYRCQKPDRECGVDEPDGTIVSPSCKPNHFFPGDFTQMRCTDGNWNYVARCVPVSSGSCILPPFPANGTYVVAGVPSFAPGQAFITVALTISCQPGYDIAGSKERTCYNGVWSGDVNDCVPKSQLCILPQQPIHAVYSLINFERFAPGDILEDVALEYKCDIGYALNGTKKISCHNGQWSKTIDDCYRITPVIPVQTLGPVFEIDNSTLEPGKTRGYCRLEKDPSVNYRCLLSAASSATRECNEYEPVSTIVRPECKVPNYYFPRPLNHMRCFEDKWNYIARCVPECGLVTPKGTELVVGGRAAERGELPWHAGVYRKYGETREQICGGSLVSPKLVVSAGHCFVDNAARQQPAALYSVALGKLYRPWQHPGDRDVHKSDVKEIKFPLRFSGSIANFQDDIALLLLVEAVVYQTHIRPVCVDYSREIEDEQLMSGNLGKIAGWGLTDSANENSFSEVLKVVELPFVPIAECQREAPMDFREYITGDKICAGYRNGTAVCQGDSGGGLAFPRATEGKTRYYLRGVASTAPVGEQACNANWLTTFTLVTRHERFIKDNVEM